MMKIRKEQLVEAIEEAGVEARLYEDYSGRFMYGETCVGIVHGEPGVPTAVAAAAERLGYYEVVEALTGQTASRDSMGLDRITYWPSVQLESPTPTAS